MLSDKNTTGDMNQRKSPETVNVSAIVYDIDGKTNNRKTKQDLVFHVFPRNFFPVEEKVGKKYLLTS